MDFKNISINQTLDMCLDDHRFYHLLKIAVFLWRACGFVGVLVGLPGHICHIVTLCSIPHPKNPQALYMIAVSVCDLIFLLGVFWFWGVTAGFIHTDPRLVFSCGIFYGFMIGSSGLSNFYLALMCINRSVMILWPLQYRARMKQSRVIIQIFIVAILTIVSLVPHHFYLHYDRKTTFFLCEFRSSVSRKRILIWSFIHAIIYVSIPMLIVGLSSFILLVNRYRHHQLHKNNQSLIATRMFNRSILMTFVSVGLGISVIPACILQIFIIHDQLFSNDSLCSIRWIAYKILLNCFLVLSAVNYSMKFYIHLVVSTSFRKRFIRLITCQRKNRGGSTPSATATISRKEEEKMIPITAS